VSEGEKRLQSCDKHTPNPDDNGPGFGFFGALCWSFFPLESFEVPRLERLRGIAEGNRAALLRRTPEEFGFWGVNSRPIPAAIRRKNGEEPRKTCKIHKREIKQEIAEKTEKCASGHGTEAGSQPRKNRSQGAVPAKHAKSREKINREWDFRFHSFRENRDGEAREKREKIRN
jgi:hypothetical protein